MTLSLPKSLIELNDQGGATTLTVRKPVGAYLQWNKNIKGISPCRYSTQLLLMTVCVLLP